MLSDGALLVEYIGQSWFSSNGSATVNFDVMPAPFTVFRTWLLLASALVKWTQSMPLRRADACPGFTASNVQKTDGGITADLTLAGAECNVYGTDLHDLKFEASYQTGELVHRLCMLLALYHIE